MLAAGAAVAITGVGCGGEPTPPKQGEGPDDDAVPVPEGKAAVAVVHVGEADEAVERAIALAGGLAEIRPGDTVFIKPNAVHGYVDDRPGVITSLAIVKAVVRAMKDRGARVTVGDRSARMFDSAFVFDLSGLREAALEAGADEVFAAQRPEDAPDEWVLVQPPKYEETWSSAGGILAMKRILEADHFIDLPVCKNHRWAGHSLSMKNLIGAIGDASRDALHFNVADPERLSRDIAILNQPFHPRMAILDAQTALLNGGPEGVLSDRVLTTPGLVMASKDRIALDAAAVALIKVELGRTDVPEPDEVHAILKSTAVWSLPQIVHGIERGLGVPGHGDVELRFEDVADAEAIEAMFRA
jgi:uncharacterized protein (DUF362 family)